MKVNVIGRTICVNGRSHAHKHPGERGISLFAGVVTNENSQLLHVEMRNRSADETCRNREVLMFRGKEPPITLLE